MSYWMLFLGIALVSALIFGPMASRIAEDNQRSPVEGLMLGLIFGPIGALAEAFLPKGRYRTVAGRTPPTDAWDKLNGPR